MRLTSFTPRLLPVTIAVLAAVLALKTTHLVRAAMPPPAQKTETPAAQPMEQHAAASTPPAAPAVTLPKPAEEPAVSPQERALLLDLRRRHGELDARDATLATRESILAAAEKRLAARVDELTALQRRLEALEADRKAREEANWQGLVKLYEQMKPRDAATIFNDLDKPVLLQVLTRMKEARAAPILAAMQPERARFVTADLAEMRLKENRLAAASPPNKAITQPQGTK
jgi:flagellar motility protein MotE (MotC chaperone)